MLEYRVRKVSRFVVTEYVENDDVGPSIITFGLFDNVEHANKVAEAFSKEQPGSVLMLGSDEKPSYWPQAPINDPDLLESIKELVESALDTDAAGRPEASLGDIAMHVRKKLDPAT